MKLPGGDGMLLRCVTAFTLIPFLVIIVWLPQLRWAFIMVVVALTALGAREFFQMARQAGLDGADRLGTLLTPLLALSVGLADVYNYDSHAPLAIILFIMFSYHLFSLRHSILSLSVSIFPLIYIGYCGSFFIRLHQTPAIGPFLITFLVVSIGCSDTAAYVVGKSMGRHKLAPKISPNKTLEGSAAALLFACISGAALYALKHGLEWNAYPDWPILVYMGAALCLSVSGQIGDLAESMLKRNAGVKDSGNIFPGHGGALDRCDAFMFGGPTLYCLTLLFKHWGF